MPFLIYPMLQKWWMMENRPALPSVAGAKLRIPATAVTLVLILYFWATGLAGLDRWPKIHEDEAWQAAPGYTFWAEGRFATDLFAGFYGMERHYYGFMPLFPLLVGGALHLFGLGLFQARLVPLALGLLTLALTARLGRRLFSPWHGSLAVAALAGWRIASPFAHLLRGIPLADAARITRYDSAVPVFGLAALLILVETLNKPPASEAPTLKIQNSKFKIQNYFWAGLLTGLAALSHVYGAFWLVALGLALAWCLGRQALRPALLVGAGFGLALTPWFYFVASGWSDFIGQNANYADRFGLFDPRFYLANLLAEAGRYRPLLAGPGHSLGAWLWLPATAGGLAWLVYRAGQAGDPSARLLISALAGLAGCFALLLTFKTFTYLVTLWPLLALATAAGLGWAWRAGAARPGLRLLLLLLIGLALAEGGLVTTRQILSGRAATPYRVYLAEIAAQLPPSARVMGLPHYWLGLGKQYPTYQAILVPVFWTDARYVARPVSFGQAAQALPPQVILLDSILLDFLAGSASPDRPGFTLAQDIRGYLADRQARQIGQVDDSTYGRLEIYRLEANFP